MNDFNFIIPLRKDAGDITGIASTSSVDRDDERMSEKALADMIDGIKREGINLFGNHEHNWENTLGVVKDANLSGSQVLVKIGLDDPITNPKVPMLLNKLKRGIKLGLSVGGNVKSFKWEYDKAVGKKIKVLDSVEIYEVSVVGIPSNKDSFLTIPQAIAKSARLPELKKCFNCNTKTEKENCPICLTKL